MNAHPALSGILTSEEHIHILNDSTTRNQRDDENSNDILLPNVFNTNIQLQKLMDDVLSTDYTTHLSLNLSEILSKYISCLKSITEQEREFLSTEIEAFYVHFYMILLLILFYSSSNKSSALLAVRLNEIMDLHISFIRANTTCKQLCKINIKEMFPEKFTKIEKFVNELGSSELKACFQNGKISRELLVSTLVNMHCKAINSLAKADISEIQFDLSSAIKNYTEIICDIGSKIAYQITTSKFIELNITNDIISNIFAAMLNIFDSEQLKKDYSNIAAESYNEPFNLAFLSFVFALNCKASLVENDQKQKICLNLTLEESMLRKGLLTAEDINEHYQFEIELTSDPKYNEKEAVLNFFQRFIQV